MELQIEESATGWEEFHSKGRKNITGRGAQVLKLEEAQ